MKRRLPPALNPRHRTPLRGDIHDAARQCGAGAVLIGDALAAPEAARLAVDAAGQMRGGCVPTEAATQLVGPPIVIRLALELGESEEAEALGCHWHVAQHHALRLRAPRADGSVGGPQERSAQ